MIVRRSVRITGTVQGVGFRPFVHREASELGLVGTVRNDSDGVLVDVSGDECAVACFEERLATRPPPLARVLSVRSTPVSPPAEFSFDGGFVIVTSDGSAAPNAAVSVDAATCDACVAEILDPADRRHRYPFTNCTNCGPRYTIVRSVPYDRAATTMAGFAMCPPCRSEYDDPTDRRFHAQPNACPDCGPSLRWSGDVVGGEALTHAVDALRSGAVVAIKGLGGFHLAVDATDERAVATLRQRKSRDDKPFAVMVADLDVAATMCHLDGDAVAALSSSVRPVVLAPRRNGCAVADGVAPGLPDLGLMLPYTPLHHLLAREVDRPLVLTSGNVSDEPIAHLDDDATARLAPLVDGVLGHDRPIHIRCDDSVVRATGVRTQVLRRSRGYAPQPIPLPVSSTAHVLAVGAEMKSTVSVAKEGLVVASHHIGDLEHLANYEAFLQAVEHLADLHGVVPEVVACDLHPEYLSTKFAHDLSLPIVEVQHHHAHVAACMVEHGETGPVVALAFDGLGYGTDGTIWGGEVLVADLVGFERAAHLRPVAMPGGVAAIREPWRMAAVWAGGAAVGDVVDGSVVEAVLGVAASAHAPMTTSVGRLFDAVGALLCGRTHITYEGQAAIELEALARSAQLPSPGLEGTVAFVDGVLDPTPLVHALVRDRDAGVDRGALAAGFHAELGRGAADAASRVAVSSGIDTVVLTGGVFQNVVLTEVIESALLERGHRVLVHEQLTPNDGSISIGQAAVAAARSQ